MRIVDVCPFYTPHGGGVRTYVEQKLRHLPRLGHEVVILAPGDEDGVIERGPGARIVLLKSPRFPLDRKYGYFADEAKVHAALDELQPDFVEASSPWRSAGIVANWPSRAARALVMHADPLSAFAYRWFGAVFSQQTIDWQFSVYWEHLRKHSRRYEYVVCANAGLSARLAAGDVANTVTMPMGVEPGLFSPERRDPELRARLLAACDLPPEASLLLGIGRLAPEKRWPMVVDAVSAAAAKRPIGLVLLGEGREQRTLLRHIAGNPHVRLFAPERDRRQFARIVASADALVHGCEAETYCMAAAEARASGVAIVVPDEGGAADHVHGGGGVAYAPGSASSAAAAILKVLDSQEPTIPASRSIDRHFDELCALYERALAAPARARPGLAVA